MQIALQPLVFLYLAFSAKQLLADYFLQSTWMAMGKKAPHGWRLPLAAHAGVHAGGTLLIALAAAPSFWWLAPIDFAVHAVIDRGKAVLSRGLAFENVRFWWAFGLDQTAHQVTHFAFLLAMLVRA